MHVARVCESMIYTNIHGVLKRAYLFALQQLSAELLLQIVELVCKQFSLVIIAK